MRYVLLEEEAEEGGLLGAECGVEDVAEEAPGKRLFGGLDEAIGVVLVRQDGGSGLCNAGGPAEDQSVLRSVGEQRRGWLRS
jgi:hypothetical protein